MKIAPFPENEAARLYALQQYQVLDTEPESAFDDLTRLASRLCGTPIALVSLVDAHRQWFKSKVGIAATETSRDVAFCGHTILQHEVLIVPNALADERFATNPLVTSDPGIRFYAGTPLVTPTGEAVGTLCVIDQVPRTLTPEQIEILQVLGRQVVAQLELRRSLVEVATMAHEAKTAEGTLRQQAQTLEHTLRELRQTQAKLVQSEKMSSLGRLVAGMAHEINNPVTFISGNLAHAQKYIQRLLSLVTLYQQHYPNPAIAIATELEDLDLEFVAQDLPKLLASMQVGAERIEEIVRSLRTFSHLDESEIKPVDLHQGLESALMILKHRLQAKSSCSQIEIIKNYGNLPIVECYAAQLNQVFMNILVNALDALEDRDRQRSLEDRQQRPSQIRICTEVLDSGQVRIRIADNGNGIPERIKPQMFDPFFTTKPVGQGIGLGLSISYQIVTEKHRGTLYCHSLPEQGTEFVIEIPIQQSSTIGPSKSSMIWKRAESVYSVR